LRRILRRQVDNRSTLLGAVRINRLPWVDTPTRSGIWDLLLCPAWIHYATLGSAFLGLPETHRTGKDFTMAGKTEQIKGQAKEAAGSLIGNKDLQDEGKTDRQAGAAKEKAGHAKDKVEEVVEKVEHKVEDAIDSATDAVHRDS
jgi:uncharacterized protein YjbJ (UPF0337 family)